MQSIDEHDLITSSIEALIEDSEFERLTQQVSESTIFDVLGITTEERIHSSMLGWLLDPTGSHGVGDIVLRRFLYRAAKLARSNKIGFGENGKHITPLQAETLALS